ncbi:hypothetical protein, partial [Treponema endosymbiont of Eucomonympha sp.]|uniref:hypothetical protein n=1 Tax=Treponema endosymbiont of Eucomonympha sp. TaxID=1580831 RepID=UPI000A4BE414
SNRLPTIVHVPVSRHELEIPFIKSGISPMAPRKLTLALQSLPPIPHERTRVKELGKMHT